MNTPTNAYITKLSSGTIVALLVFSGLLVLVPFATTVHAAQNPNSAYTLTPSFTVYTSSQAIDTQTVTVANAGPYALTSITITTPSAYSFAAADADECATSILSTALVTTNAITCSGGTALPAGQSVTLNIGDLTAPSSSASSAATVSTFTTTMVDGGSSPASYAGPSMTLYVIASTTVAGPSISGLSGSNFVAGSAALTLTSSVTSGQQGVPVTFSSSVTTGSFSPSSGLGLTSSSGVASGTYTPTNTATSSITLTATIATSSAATGTDVFNVIAGAPSTITVTAGGSSTKTDYITAMGTQGSTTMATIAATGITGTLADAFGNSVTSGVSGTSCTLTSIGGSFGSSAASTDTGGACTATSINNDLAYFQSSAYGSSTTVSFSMSGTYNSASFTATGKSQSLVTSTFDSGTSQTPTASPSAGSITAGTAAGVVSTITLTYTFTNAQAGVPVTFTAINTTETGTTLSGSFVGGNGPSEHPNGVPSHLVYANITVSSTVSSGTATAKATFTIDPTLSAAVSFKAQVAAPITGTSSNKLALSSATGTFTTTVGAAAKFVVKTYFDSGRSVSTTKTVAGQSDYIDVFLDDYWGNNVAAGGQLQIALAVSPSSSGTLSATSVYIQTGKVDTFNSFGTITFAVASTAPLGAISISATGFYPSTPGTLTVVSANPTVTVNSPSGTVGHTVYSNVAGVGFTGTAAVSAGVYTSPATTISSVSYTIDGGSAASATGTTSWSFGTSLSNGLHTIGIYSKDSNGAVSATNSTLVLVDPTAPTITVTSSSSIGVGSPVTFSIVDSEGDLKASTVAATTNSSATLTTTVTGTNNPGSSVTYTVTVAGLPASSGHWSVTLNAKDLAGNAATAVTATVKVTVAFAQSVVVSGTPSYSTLGGFTGISATYTNNWNSAQSVVVFAVWKNSLGQTVAVSTGGLTLASGATATAFAPLASPLASGSYTVSVFVITTANNPVSVSSSISVTV